jgi:hypothetical protein
MHAQPPNPLDTLTLYKGKHLFIVNCKFRNLGPNISCGDGTDR